MDEELKAAAAIMSRRGGQVKSARKALSSAANGRMNKKKSLVVIHDNIPLVSTLDMAEALAVENRSLVKMLQKQVVRFETRGVLAFQMLKPTSKFGGRPEVFAMLNEEQATFLVLLMKNSDPVIDLKDRLSKEFFRMRRIIATITDNRRDPLWLQARSEGKVDRKEFTDTVKEFEAYARNDGSSSPEKYYMLLTKMTNAEMFDLEDGAKYKNLRDVLDSRQLRDIAWAERAVLVRALKEGMELKLPYKKVYELARDRMQALMSISRKTIVPAGLTGPAGRKGLTVPEWLL